MSKPVEQILANYETATLRAQLQTDLPGQITAAKVKARDRRDKFQELEQARALAEASLMTDISAEIDPGTGKAAYSNEKARAAELLGRKARDTDYRQAEAEAKAAKWAYETAQDELDELFTRNRNYLAVVNVIAAELSLLAAYEGQEAGLSPQEIAAAEDAY